jgi:hypothetical protein
MYKWIRHNIGTVVSFVLASILIVWAYGCESQVKSLTGVGMVTRDEMTVELNSEVRRLEAEIDKLNETATTRYTQLDRKDAIKAKLFDTVAIATQAGTFNSIGLATLAGSLMAIGLGVDNRIKGTVIKNRPLSNSQPVSTG